MEREKKKAISREDKKKKEQHDFSHWNRRGGPEVECTGRSRSSKESRDACAASEEGSGDSRECRDGPWGRRAGEREAQDVCHADGVEALDGAGGGACEHDALKEGEGLDVGGRGEGEGLFAREAERVVDVDAGPRGAPDEVADREQCAYARWLMLCGKRVGSGREENFAAEVAVGGVADEDGAGGAAEPARLEGGADGGGREALHDGELVPDLAAPVHDGDLRAAARGRAAPEARARAVEVQERAHGAVRGVVDGVAPRARGVARGKDVDGALVRAAAHARRADAHDRRDARPVHARARDELQVRQAVREHRPRAPADPQRAPHDLHAAHRAQRVWQRHRARLQPLQHRNSRIQYWALRQILFFHACVATAVPTPNLGICKHHFERLDLECHRLLLAQAVGNLLCPASGECAHACTRCGACGR